MVVTKERKEELKKVTSIDKAVPEFTIKTCKGAFKLKSMKSYYVGFENIERTSLGTWKLERRNT